MSEPEEICVCGHAKSEHPPCEECPDGHPMPCKECKAEGKTCYPYRAALSWPTDAGWWWCSGTGDLVWATKVYTRVQVYYDDSGYYKADWRERFGRHTRFTRLREKNPFEVQDAPDQ